ncbi:MAG: TonB-dependent receptor [Bacteroidota bacterium]
MGVVVDRVSQERLPVVNVQVLGTTLGASSNSEGRFTITGVAFGTYEVRASLVGYEPLVLADIVVNAGKPTEMVIELGQMPVDLETIEVTASYFQNDPDVPLSVQRLSYEEIRRSPGGFEDVVRAISVFPGVAQVEPGRNDLVVRGGAPSENLFVIDNIEIPNINHFGTQGATGGPLSFINLDFVRETSFSTGGFGVRYGDKLSSVLNIDLRSGRRDQLGGKATVSATMFGLNLEGPLQDKGSFVLSARRSYLDFIFKASGFSFVPEYWDFLARFDYSLDEANTLTILGIGALDDVNFSSETLEDRYDNARIYGTKQSQYSVGLSWRHLFKNGFSTVTLGRWYVEYEGQQKDIFLNPIFLNLSKESETDLRADVVLKAFEGNTEFTFGSQVKRVRGDYTMKLPPFVTSFGDTISADLDDAGGSGYKGSLYAQVVQRLPLRFQLNLGGRVDYFGVIDRKFYFSPRGSLSHALSAQTTVTLSAGLYHQFPSYVWLVGTPGNTSLDAINVEQYILGIEHLPLADVKLRVETFAKRYSDYPTSVARPYLVMANTGGGYQGTEDDFSSFGLDPLVSMGSGRSYGVEFLVQKKLSEIPLYGLISVTVSDTRFSALDGVERSGTYDQRAIINLSGGYRFDERWEASFRFRFATGRPYTPYNPDGTQSVADYNSLRLRNTHSLDLRADRRWNFTGWALIAYLDIQNVYNNKIVTSVRWNSLEQRPEFNESIGILPSIGISAEF